MQEYITRRTTHNRRHVDRSTEPPTVTYRPVDVTVQIDVAGILAELGRKAANNKTGRAIEFGGLIKAVRDRETR
jgi:hypothetical protein